MTLGNKIAYYRKNAGITQETLARQLKVSNQAVSKWESDQCCPDVTFLPQLADIFHVTIDELFDRAPSVQSQHSRLPWANDDTLRVVLYMGHHLVNQSPVAENISFTYTGAAVNIVSSLSVNCADVEGNVRAGGTVNCGNISGDADAGGNIYCGNVEGDVDAGGNVTCGNVEGDVDAGGTVSCGDVGGDVDAGGNVNCGDVGGDVDAGTYVKCGSISGDADAGETITIG